MHNDLCPDKGFESQRLRLVNQLAEMIGFIESIYLSLPGHLLSRQPEHDDLTLLEHLWHVRDCDCELYGLRIARTLAEDIPLFASVDVSNWPTERAYMCQPAPAAIRDFVDVRQTLVTRLGRLNAAGYARKGRLLALGQEVDVFDLAEMLIEHDRDHRQRMVVILTEFATKPLAVAS